jgi:hypothetical protein
MVGEVLRRKKASVRDAPLPGGSRSWDDLWDERLSEVDWKARRNVLGYKTIRKILSDRRFDK